MLIVYYTYYTPVSDFTSIVESQEHMLGRRLLLAGMKNIYQIDCTMDGLDSLLTVSPNGKPYLDGLSHIHFNITHCDRLVACAFADHPIGIDAELPSHFEDVLIKKVLSPEEKHFFNKIAVNDKLRTQWFFRFWTLKEAYVKKIGTGIRDPLSGITFTFSRACTPYSVTCSDSAVVFWQHTLKSGHILSVCHSHPEKSVLLVFQDL